MSNARIRTIAYWTATILGPTSFVIGGYLGLTRAAETIEPMRHLGYPLYFGQLLGAWKILGALAITLPAPRRVKEWAYAGFFFDLTAAAYSHAMVGDAASEIVTPLVFLVFVVASWALQDARHRHGDVVGLLRVPAKLAHVAEDAPQQLAGGRAAIAAQAR